MRSMSLVRADIRYAYQQKSTDWLMYKRQLLIQRLVVCDEILAKRGKPLLPPVIVEILAVAGKRHRDEPVLRPWRTNLE